MKKVIRVLAVVVVVCICDIMIGFIGDWYINSLSNYSFLRAQICNVVLNKEADVLIIGASKANHSYITEAFSSDSVTAFNAGIDGTDCYTADMVLHALCSRRIPKLVVFDIADRQVEISPDQTVEMFSYLYGKAKPIEELMEEELDPLERIKLNCN
ncbi:MAG: hypothetical protein IK004_08700 [Bacteroidales bacterium]|nr:hypothetical protein [Bacteroidales bacterium]